MAGRAVELRVAGLRCSVVTTADEEELAVLALMVEEKLSKILRPGRPVDTQAMVLAAVALAADLREERKRGDEIAAKAKRTLEQMLLKVDAALTESEANLKPRAGRRSRFSSASRSGASGSPTAVPTKKEQPAAELVARVEAKKPSELNAGTLLPEDS